MRYSPTVESVVQPWLSGQCSLAARVSSGGGQDRRTRACPLHRTAWRGSYQNTMSPSMVLQPLPCNISLSHFLTDSLQFAVSKSPQSLPSLRDPEPVCRGPSASCWPPVPGVQAVLPQESVVHLLPHRRSVPTELLCCLLYPVSSWSIASRAMGAWPPWPREED